MPEQTVTRPDRAVQVEMPFAIVQGEPLTVLPQDLYIPPDAMEVILEAFEGPLDLLLYLIKRQNLDILNIPIADITQQYTQYISMMGMFRLELAAEYLVMAALLAEIKSRMLLPRPIEAEDEDDPRAELIKRLQEYERFKNAADQLAEIPRMERDNYPVNAGLADFKRLQAQPEISLRELLLAFKTVVGRAEMFAHHHVEREALSVRERMSVVLGWLKEDQFIEFTRLFDASEGRLGVVVTFLAVLELIKESLIDIVQADVFAPIYLQARQSGVEPNEELRETQQ